MNEQKEKFTPGPWVVLDQRELFNEDYDFSVGCSDGYVCRVENCKLEEEEANAHLISAAPKMYELLDMIRKAITLDEGILGSCLSKIEPLLKEARGEE